MQWTKEVSECLIIRYTYGIKHLHIYKSISGNRINTKKIQHKCLNHLFSRKNTSKVRHTILQTESWDLLGILAFASYSVPEFPSGKELKHGMDRQFWDVNE